MTSGPFAAGGVSRNNQFSVSWSPPSDIPAGALIWVIGGTNIADTADVSVTDTAGNNYINQAFVAPPGLDIPILVAVSRNSLALPATGTITITASIRGNWDANSYFHTDARGEIFSADVEFFDTGTTPVATVQGQNGMTLFGALAVAGPSADGFTPDPNWSADLKGSIARTNATLHASGRLANSQGQVSYSYAPILGTARRSLIFAAAFF